MMRIDSHQHYWITARSGDYYWMNPEIGMLYRDFLPRDLEPARRKSGIDGTVVVQAAEALPETEWLLELVESEPSVLGVVGWLDFEDDPDVFARKLDQLRQKPKFCGLRPMLQDMEDDRYILRPRVIENARYVARQGVPFDILIYPKHLPAIHDFLLLVPGLRAVVDHIAKPFIKDGILEPWGHWMSRISRFPNVWCKLSGMVTEADRVNWTTDHFIPYVHHVVTSFGTDRIMFGSDWPVCLQAAEYNEVVVLLEEALPGELTASEREAVFGHNCLDFYKLSVKPLE